VVVGGGPTGVETAGALLELVAVSVRRDRLRIDPERTRVVLVDVAERLLSGFSETAGRYAADTLRSRGVEVHLGERVAEVTENGVRLSDGTTVPADAVVWAGGVTVTGTLADGLPVEQAGGGRVVVGPDLSVPGRPEVFVVGDAAAAPLGRGRPGTAPQLAQGAIQSGRHAGQEVLRRVEGATPEPFAYRDKGVMATIGRHAAVAELPRLPTVGGTLGWLAWLGLHLVYLIGFRNRLVVLLNWTWRYFDWPSGPRLIVADVESETPT
jgi:NADH dehydrogenase